MAVGDPPGVKPGVSWKDGDPEKAFRMDAHLEWLLTPKELRLPATKYEHAEKLGVTRQTLNNYELDESFRKKLRQEMKARFGVEAKADVLASLIAQAQDTSNPRSVQAAKILLTWEDETATAADGRAPIDMTDEQLGELAMRMLQQMTKGVT